MLVADYLNKLALDLRTVNKLLSKINHVIKNENISKILDGVTEQLDKHATQLEEIVDTVNQNNS